MTEQDCAYWLDPDGLLLLRGWARDGFSEEKIAGKIGVPVSTLRAWRQDHPQIGQALKRGREISDYMAEEALFRAALGYEVTEREEKTDQKGGIVVTEKTKHVPPVSTLLMFWLKNRRRDRWGDVSAETLEEEAAERSLESFRAALFSVLPGLGGAGISEDEGAAHEA